MEVIEPNGKKILCIEDESFISELYARALRRSGYEVNTLISGLDGLNAAKKDEYDIILLDLMIPGMTGFEVLRELKSLEKPLKAKILITTNSSNVETLIILVPFGLVPTLLTSI